MFPWETMDGGSSIGSDLTGHKKGPSFARGEFAGSQHTAGYPGFGRAHPSGEAVWSKALLKESASCFVWIALRLLHTWVIVGVTVGDIFYDISASWNF